MDNQQLFEQLLHSEDESDVERILESAGYGLENDQVWYPLGDMENNFSTVGNQQTEPTAAFVEKIINGIDAMLMAACYERNIDPESDTAPESMNAAVDQFFRVREGRLETLDSKAQTALADYLHVVAVGQKMSPSYLIIDRGEGQTPAAFPDTFLSLNRSNKLRIPFVQGKFNSGGTGVLQFCGEKNMQLIVSRRHPSAPSKSGDPTRDLWGFTIVRRMRPKAGRRNSMYVYLAPGGAVPSFAGDSIKVLPEKRSTVVPRPYAVELSYGTCIKLYNYRWKGRSIATTEARYELERYLHSPCLPFRLTETRDYSAHYFSTTVSGVWVSVASASGEPESAKIEPGFPAYAELHMSGIGHLPYRIVVFKEEVKSRHVPHGVFFTLNGQVHGGLPADFISRSLKFDYLSGYLLVSVDCTAMESSVREDFFMASRDRIRKNEFYEEIVDRLQESLREHQGLRDLNAARRKKDIEQTISDEKEATSFFSDLLKSDPTLSSLFSLGDRLVTSTGPGPAVPFVGKNFPTYFRLVKNPQNGLVKHCPVNRTCRVEFETDATNDYFRRADSPGHITTGPMDLIEHSNLWNGTFTANFQMPWDAKPGDNVAVTMTVEDVETDIRGKPFVSSFTLVAEPEAEPKHNPPGPKPPKPGPPDNGKKSSPALALPEIHEVRKADWEKRNPVYSPYTALEIKHSGNGTYDFFINVDNTFLLTELVRAKAEDRPLVVFWFKFGLTLCAMGMLQEAKRHEESAMAAAAGASDGKGTNGGEVSSPVEDLERINAYSSGIARVIVPIIRRLYRGPERVS